MNIIKTYYRNLKECFEYVGENQIGYCSKK